MVPRRTAPPPVHTLPAQQLGSPAKSGHPGSLGRYGIGPRLLKILHDLPANGGVGIQQSVDDRHGRGSAVVTAPGSAQTAATSRSTSETLL